LQDSAYTNGQNVEIPYLWLEAFAYGLSQRLAMVWAPDKLPIIQPFAEEAYRIAADQNVEQANQYISPQISGYFR
jgi:hypothetical protein